MKKRKIFLFMILVMAFSSANAKNHTHEIQGVFTYSDGSQKLKPIVVPKSVTSVQKFVPTAVDKNNGLKSSTTYVRNGRSRTIYGK